MRTPVSYLAALGILFFTLQASGVAADQFVVTSSAFKDGAPLPRAYGSKATHADGTACGGKDVSPPLAWSGAPAGTKSYAIVMHDPDGRKGLGVNHWIAYNIPASVTTLAEGQAAAAGFAGGKNSMGTAEYHGPCPPTYDPPHHYEIEVYALDSDPSLPAGLDRDDLLKAIEPHILRNASIVGTYGYIP